MEISLLSHLSKKFRDVFTRRLVYMNIEDGIQKLPTLLIAVLHGDSEQQRLA